MARENYNAAYIGSSDYWGFDNETFNDETNFYGDVWVVDSDGASSDAVDDQNLNPCALYYEVGKTDDHLFTPTEIIYDNDAGVLLIVGEQGRIGEPEVTAEQRRFYSIGQKARRYKHMTDGKESREAGRFAVSTIVVSNDPQKKEIVEYLEKIEDDLSASSAENWSAEGDSQDYMEEWNADNIDRINPVYVEGAEDVHGAEGIYEAQGIGPVVGNVIPEPHFVNNQELMEESRKNRDAKDGESFETEESLIGQGDEGRVVGHSAESFDVQSAFIHSAEGNESWAVEVHNSDGGVFLAELDTGLILHNNSSFSAEDDTPLSAEEMNAILSIAAESEATPVYSFNAEYSPMDYNPDSHNPTSVNPSTEPHESEDVVEFIQEVSPFQISGWVASALVVGSALAFGRMSK
tara:strand:+ start:2476 stop:3693 length:1218 start_codon:yes stop_codon:yes gene_type:complete